MTAPDDRLRERARAWIAGDPDPTTRGALEAVLRSGDRDELTELVDGALEFGTAGLRGVVGPGPRRMNRAVVITTTRGLADHVLERHGAAAVVVVGRDARTMSDEFARDTVAVLAAAGLSVRYFPDPVPTPLVAFASRYLGAAAAVVVTASHNPPEYNGYKVYAANGAQIIPPEDAEIAAAIAAVGPADEVPMLADPYGTAPVEPLGREIVGAYLDGIEALRQRPARTVRIVHTPLHGVGGRLVEEALRRAGHDDLHVVAAQAEPDPGFPTVPFPNPEEPGALDLAVATAREVDADLVLANDPDADRLAVAVPDGDGWRLLTGNQIGALLTAELLQRSSDGTGQRLIVSSIVTSPMAREIAVHHGARHEATLTGFKWICNAAIALEDEGHEFVLGFEEALGYAVGDLVRDKDGISAAVVFADLAAELAARGRSVPERLEELYRTHGLWVSVQHAVTLRGSEGRRRIEAAMERIGQERPAGLAGHEVVGATDFRSGEDQRPWWLPAADLVRLDLRSGSRVLIRPSGTEPKLKIYADLRRDLEAGVDVTAAEEDLRQEATEVARDLARFVGVA